MRKRTFSNLALALVLTMGVVLTPGAVQAAPTASGNAYINWDSVTFTFSGAGGITWVDGESYSFSSTSAVLNGVPAGDIYEPPETFGFLDSWGATSGVSSVTDGSGTITASAFTGAAGAALASASHTVDLASFGSVDLWSQAAFGGTFNVANDGALTVTIGYHLDNAIDKLFTEGTIDSYVYAILALYDLSLEGNDPVTQALAENFLSVNGLGSAGPFAEDGTLTLTYALLTGTDYDFVAEAGTNARVSETAAAVPEPATLILLGGALLGLGILRKRSL